MAMGEKSFFSSCLSHYANAEFTSYICHNMIYEAFLINREDAGRAWIGCVGLPTLVMCFNMCDNMVPFKIFPCTGCVKRLRMEDLWTYCGVFPLFIITSKSIHTSIHALPLIFIRELRGINKYINQKHELNSSPCLHGQPWETEIFTHLLSLWNKSV